MQIVKIEYLVCEGRFAKSTQWNRILQEIKKAIGDVVWPPGNTSFIIHPSKGRGRGEGNGVKPIKDACMLSLQESGWDTNDRKNPLRLDAVKPLPDGRIFGLEWETGNISSSHRAINRILLGHMHYDLIGGVLVVPSKNLYQYLTDRVGNYPELEPYFDVWSTYPLDEGILAIIVVEQDGTSSRVPRIKKGTDGRAMI